MSRRPHQHRIGDEAESQFAATIPGEWVFRREEKDYGIDGSVEIFNEDSSHTGLRFHIQLKGTGSKNLSIQRTVKFNETTLEYWHAQELPTLLIRYCKEGKKIYFAWHFDRRIKLSKNSKKASIKLSEHDLWEETTPITLRLFLEKITRLRTGGHLQKPALRFKDVEDPESRGLQRKLRSPMEAYRTLVSFGDRRPELISLEITIENKDLVVSLEGISTAPVPIEENFEKLAANILVAGAFCLLAVGQASLGSSFLHDAHYKADLQQNDDVANILVHRLMEQKNYQLIRKVATSLWKRDLNQFATEMFIFWLSVRCA